MSSDKEIDEMIKKLEAMKKGKGKKKTKTLDEKMREEHKARTEDRNRRGFTDKEAEGWRNMGRALTDKDLEKIFKKDNDD